MKTFILSMLIICTLNMFLSAQNARIYEQKVNMTTYMFSDPSPVPDIDKSYPYCRFDGYTNKAEQKEWNMVIMENEYIKVFITPEIGGKIWGAVEKSTGGEFLYYNDVVKFRDVALRGPWTSGGLEYNFGIMSHTSTCATPQDYVLKENIDGSVSCVIGALDHHTGTRWNVEVNLQKDKAFVETIASFFNTGSIPVTYYHFMNAAAKTAGNLEFIYPGTHYIGHDGDVGDWPVENGRNISFYENNDFGSYKSYHVLNAYTDFIGGYWHDDEFGFGHLCDYDERPGKKLWLWGLSQQGMIWEDLLTDNKGQYIEFQSGKLFNQAMEQSTKTPFKHRDFFPHDADVMREIWFPLKKTRGMVTASRYGVLNVVKKDRSVEILLSALQDLKENLVVKSNDHVIIDDQVDLKPLNLFVSEVEIGSGENFTIELGNQLLYYSSEEEDRIVERPLEPNQEFDWNSATGLYTLGVELEKQQSYMRENAFVRAQEYYFRSLEKDPAYAPALNRLGLSFYRQMEYKKGLDPILNSLSIDTYDGEANYYYGLIQKKLGNSADAKSGFSIAAQSTAYRTAAYTELAELYLAEKDFQKAIDYARKAITYNQNNMAALEIMAVVSRQVNDPELSDHILSRIYELEETSPFVAFEKILRGGEEMEILEKLITNELVYQSYLDLAIRYFELGFPQESITILKAAPDHVTILLWLAFLDEGQREEWLDKALVKSPDFVFPFREETFSVLENLIKTEDDWKLKYYKSLIYWKKGLQNEARNLMQQCGTIPDYAPFYLAKATLFEDDPVVKKEAVDKAAALDPADWRVNLARINLFLAENKFTEAARLAKNTLDTRPEMAILGISYGIALLKSGEYDKCLDFLDSFVVLPYEGANEGRNIYHEACIRASFEALKQKKYKNAINLAEKAKQWPLNLGAGRPYDVDETLENFMIAYGYEKTGKNPEAGLYYQKVAEGEIPDGRNGSTSFYLRMKALKKLNREKDARNLLQKIESEEPGNIYVEWAKAMESQDDPELLTKRIMDDEEEKMPFNNQFLLVNELLTIIE